VEIKLTHSQLKSVQEYCKLNNIEDVDKFISKCYVNGFNISKYGLLGDNTEKIGGIEEKQVEIEVIKEIRVEVPVEKIVEVIKEVVKYVEVPIEIIKEVEVIQYVEKEVIKEVPVEIITEKIVNVIQEVPVPNIDKIGDKTQINELLSKIQQLKNRLPEIIETIKEVPVEVIKEVIVEKIVEVEKSNDKTLLLQETLQKLRKELSLKNTRIEDLEKINKQLESIKVSQGAVYMKGSNINETL
jgi:hypothetical protein